MQGGGEKLRKEVFALWKVSATGFKQKFSKLGRNRGELAIRDSFLFEQEEPLLV